MYDILSIILSFMAKSKLSG